MAHTPPGEQSTVQNEEPRKFEPVSAKAQPPRTRAALPQLRPRNRPRGADDAENGAERSAHSTMPRRARKKKYVGKFGVADEPGLAADLE